MYAILPTFRRSNSFAMIGRKKETAILTNAYATDKPELVAVLGRRRVGKTYLVRSFFEGKIDFELTAKTMSSRCAKSNFITMNGRCPKAMLTICVGKRAFFAMSQAPKNNFL
jgi:hypothetical protein